jgi:hypothetical protein
MDAIRGRLLGWTRPATADSLVLGAAADLVRCRPELIGPGVEEFLRVESSVQF